jgi:isopentenyldiphosphate isomerase
MEIRDLYDENKVLTGETIEKGKSIPKDRYYLTVVVWIQNPKGEFLLQLTSPQKHHMWSTTGGHPKAGESSLDGILTEVKEELGISINKDNLKLFKTIKTEDDFVDLYYLNMDINIDNVHIQEDEVETVKWMNIAEVKSLIENNQFLPSHIDFFNVCLAYLNI